jgi:hypothetical protein
MSLVNRFEVTLKDFWPGHADRMFVTDRDHGTTTAISRRLYVELKAYAQDNQLSFDAIVQKLHDEIHSEAIAEDHPVTATTANFAKGDRIRLSAKAIKLYQNSPINRPWWRIPTKRSGTVAYNSRKQNGVAVIWNGTKTPQYISSGLLERSDD